jgi:inner membrane protein
MDNVTHALAGLLLADATVALAERRARRPASPSLRRVAAVVGVLTAELPDVDVFYAGPVLGLGRLGYLLHHRGHTHTVVFAVLAALVVWAAALALARGLRAPAERNAVLALALVGTLSHLALDYTNNYGVHPFWPVSNAWHYGDAVFIVEPWLWVAALPPLLLGARARVTRALLGAALVAIVAAAWGTGQVGKGAALAVTLGAVAWGALVAVARPARRVALGVTAWLGVEGVFFAASHAARARVRAAVGPPLADAVLTPAVSNPFCVRALIVELDGATYRVVTATVAPFPGLRDVRGCGGGGPFAVGEGLPSARPASTAVRWGTEWSAPRAELAALAAENCEVAAALRFIRVPVWRRAPDGTVLLGDLRYGGTAGGFAAIASAARPAACPNPALVPPWTPPRRDALGGTVAAGGVGQ